MDVYGKITKPFCARLRSVKLRWQGFLHCPYREKANGYR
jgi:hypothetical protein